MNFRRSIMIADLWRPEVAISIFLRFFKNNPLGLGKFSKSCSEKIQRDTDQRVVFKFSEIWLTKIGKIVHTVRARK